MSTFSLKKTIFNGITLAIPLGIILYVLMRIMGVLKKAITPIAEKIGIERLFGEITLTILVVFVILILIFVCGLLMRLPIIKGFRSYIEGLIIRVVPSLNHLKLIAAEKLDVQSETLQWKPILLWRKNEEEYVSAYLIEETNDWIIIAITNMPSTEPGQVLITKKSVVVYKEITMTEMQEHNKLFGKGYLSLIDTNV
jgi:hypothetical protein